MAWIAPKTDWDTVPKNPLPEDLNRIEGNILAIFNDVDTGKTNLYNALVAKIATPASKAFSALVAVINAITRKNAATFSPSTSVQEIAAGTYLAGKQTIAAITGTATVDKVLDGYTFNSAAGIGLKGNIPSKVAATITPSQVAQEIAAGQYLSGKQTIEAVSFNAAKVLNDTTIAGKTGTMPNRAGDTAAISSHVSGTSIHVIPSNGYRDGVDDAVTITDADYVAGNLPEDTSIFGLQGSIPVNTVFPIGAARKTYVHVGLKAYKQGNGTGTIGITIDISTSSSNYEGTGDVRVATSGVIDLTNISTISFDCEMTALFDDEEDMFAANSAFVRLGVWSADPAANMPSNYNLYGGEVVGVIKTYSRAIRTLDVSALSGTYYIGVCAYTTQNSTPHVGALATAKIYSIKLS